MNKLTSCTMTELPFWKSATKSYLNCHKFVLSHWSRSLESNDYNHHGEVGCVLHKQLVRVRRLSFDISILFGRLSEFQFPHIRAFELRPSICRSTTRLLKEEYPYQFVFFMIVMIDMFDLNLEQVLLTELNVTTSWLVVAISKII